MADSSPTAAIGVQTDPEPEMVMESTASFERHLDEAIAEARALGRNIHDASHDARHFEEQIKAEKEAALEEEANWQLEIEDRGWLVPPPDPSLADVDPTTGHEGEWIPESILGRRVKDGGKRVYYKVKWRGVNVVSWELSDNIDNLEMIQKFDSTWTKVSFTASKKLRPVFYPKKRALVGQSSDPNYDRRRRGEWSCEVEPFIWIPYDAGNQDIIEQAYVEAKRQAKVPIQGYEYTIDFMAKPMAQIRQLGPNEGQSRRNVQRVVQLSEEEERALTDGMNVEQLRQYVANITEFSPLHYELLARLHEMDKVVVTTSESKVENLHTTTFGEVVNSIAEEGVEFPGFSTECFICLEDYEPSSKLNVLQCGHFFHVHCIADYLKRYSNVCPVCKAGI